MGSLGVEYCTQKSWQAKDIDIYLSHYPDFLSQLMKQNGYQQISEHSFKKKNTDIDFKLYKDLTTYLPIQIADIPLVYLQQATFYVPSVEQFLAIYQSALSDPALIAKKKADQAKVND
ncbi:hypothetical protein AB1I63_06125 [Streptococcus pneumoniae]